MSSRNKSNYDNEKSRKRKRSRSRERDNSRYSHKTRDRSEHIGNFFILTIYLLYTTFNYFPIIL